MELCGLKKQPIWLWWAIDRASHQIVGFALGERGTKTAKVLQPQLPMCRVPDDWLLKNKRPLLHGREVLQAVLATWQSRAKELPC